MPKYKTSGIILTDNQKICLRTSIIAVLHSILIHICSIVCHKNIYQNITQWLNLALQLNHHS